MTEWSPGPAWLFCPADRPDRYPKALDRADIVILDLEDAVSASRKADARQSLQRLVDDGSLQMESTIVRLNSLRTHDGAADMRLVERLGIKRVMLAKAESAEEVERIPAMVIALIETAKGVVAAEAIAGATNVVAMMWGAEDLIADLGGTASRHGDGAYRDVAMHTRARVLLAAKAGGVRAVDAVHLDIGDLEGLRKECEDAIAVGFDATAAIHPSQVEVIRRSYLPDAQAIAWARRLLHHAGRDRAVTTFEGAMVDGPVYQQAERILRLSGDPSRLGDDSSPSERAQRPG